MTLNSWNLSASNNMEHNAPKQKIKIVVFVNWTKQHFTGMWDSQTYEFGPGTRMHMEEWKAQHFAKHLANRELIRDGHEGNTSPKQDFEGNVKDDLFLKYFNKAIIDTDHLEVDASRAISDTINLNIKEEVPLKVDKRRGPKKKVKLTSKEATEDEDDENVQVEFSKGSPEGNFPGAV